MRFLVVSAAAFVAASAQAALSPFAPVSGPVASGIHTALVAQDVRLPGAPAAMSDWIDLMRTPELNGVAAAPVANALRLKGYSEEQLSSAKIVPAALQSAFARAQQRVAVRSETILRRAQSLYIALLLGDPEAVAGAISSDRPTVDALEARLIHESHAGLLVNGRRTQADAEEMATNVRAQTMFVYEMQRDRVGDKVMSRHLESGAARVGLPLATAQEFLPRLKPEEPAGTEHLAGARPLPRADVQIPLAPYVQSRELIVLVGKLQSYSDAAHVYPVLDQKITWLYDDLHRPIAMLAEDDWAIFIEIRDASAFSGHGLVALQKMANYHSAGTKGAYHFRILRGVVR
jgi:hypothetical protein